MKRLAKQMQNLVKTIVKHWNNCAKLTAVKTRMKTNMEKLTKVLTHYDTVFKVFSLKGLAHVKVFPELQVCEDYNEAAGCTKGRLCGNSFRT